MASCLKKHGSERLLHQAHDRLSMLLETDQCAPDRHAGDEGACAVDGVDHPELVAIHADILMLLAENTVCRKLGLDQLTDGDLGGLVTLGDRIETGLLLVDDGKARAEARKGLGPGGVGKAEEEISIRAHGNFRRLEGDHVLKPVPGKENLGTERIAARRPFRRPPHQKVRKFWPCSKKHQIPT